MGIAKLFIYFRYWTFIMKLFQNILAEKWSDMVNFNPLALKS